MSFRSIITIEDDYEVAKAKANIAVWTFALISTLNYHIGRLVREE